MCMLLFGWLKVADILSHPFGYDGDDIKLYSVLDLNIWKASVLMESQCSHLVSGTSEFQFLLVHSQNYLANSIGEVSSFRQI